MSRRRFVRARPGCAAAAVADALGEGVAEPVSWLPGFFQLPADVPVAGLGLDRVFPMDAASGFAVRALGAQPGERVADLCCAPGAKLCMLADAMQRRGRLVGVDVSEARAATCRGLVGRAGVLSGPDGDSAKRARRATTDVIWRGDPAAPWRLRVLCGDAREFDVGPDQDALPGGFALVADSVLAGTADGEGGGGGKGARRRAKRRAAEMARAYSLSSGQGLGAYDRVLLDAECTTDGSARHLAKARAAGPEAWAAFQERFLAPAAVARAAALQGQLLRRAFALLRAPGGVLVYSTCSLTQEQNEDVLRGFLAETPGARVDPLEVPAAVAVEGGVPGTVRFGEAGETSGMFVARVVCVGVGGGGAEAAAGGGGESGPVVDGPTVDGA